MTLWTQSLCPPQPTSNPNTTPPAPFSFYEYLQKLKKNHMPIAPINWGEGLLRKWHCSLFFGQSDTSRQILSLGTGVLGNSDTAKSPPWLCAIEKSGADQEPALAQLCVLSLNHPHPDLCWYLGCRMGFGSCSSSWHKISKLAHLHSRHKCQDFNPVLPTPTCPTCPGKKKTTKQHTTKSHGLLELNSSWASNSHTLGISSFVDGGRIARDEHKHILHVRRIGYVPNTQSIPRHHRKWHLSTDKSAVVPKPQTNHH